MWQDALMAFTNIFLGLSLIPQVYNGFKKKIAGVVRSTCLFYSIGMFLLLISFFSIKMWLSTISVLISFILWIVLLIQSIIYKKL